MILYLIGNYKKSNTGAGGHYYSVLEMAKQVGFHKTTHIISFGQNIPIAFSKEQNFTHIKSSLFDQEIAIFKTLNMIKNRGWNIKVIHAYDSNVAYIGNLLSFILKAKFCLTKCGGPVPKYYSPVVSNRFVFHPADLAYFSSKNNNRMDVAVTLLPNRVSRPLYESARAISIFGERKHDSLVIFRIGRIGKTYKDTILSSINLVQELNKVGIKSELKVIGFLESQALLDELKNISDNSVSFYTDPTATARAANLLEYCDIVVGTGRGLLEGLSTGRVVFFPVKGSKYPCLLTKDSFHFGFSENFSQRVELNTKIAHLTNPEYITEYLRNSDEIDSLKAVSIELHNQYFDSKLGAELLLKKYSEMFPTMRFYIFNNFIHRLYLFSLGVANIFR